MDHQASIKKKMRCGHLVSDSDSGEENLVGKFSFTYILAMCCSNTMRRLASKDLQHFLLYALALLRTVAN
jgi:hypothetical protein